MPRSFLLLLLVPAVLAGAPRPLDAQETPDSSSTNPSRTERAQRAFERGVALYERHEYAEAIVQFKKGYHLVPNPIFLYNIASAEARLGNHRDAVETARKALEETALKGADRAKTQGLERSSRVALRAAAVARSGPKEPALREPKPPSPEPTNRQASSADATSAPETRDRGGGIQTVGWIGVTGATLGAGALVASAVLSSEIDSDLEELERLEGKSGAGASFEEKKSAVRSKQTAGRVLFIAGAGLTAVGGTLVVTDLLTPSSNSGARATVTLRAPPRMVIRIDW